MQCGSTLMPDWPWFECLSTPIQVSSCPTVVQRSVLYKENTNHCCKNKAHSACLIGGSTYPAFRDKTACEARGDRDVFAANLLMLRCALRSAAHRTWRQPCRWSPWNCPRAMPSSISGRPDAVGLCTQPASATDGSVDTVVIGAGALRPACH